MMLIEGALEFVRGLDWRQVLFYFWPFFIFDFARYVLLDLLILLRFLPRRRRDMRRRAWARQQLFRRRPLVSVVVPGRNEGRHIPALARSLAAQTYDNLEIIIVDDGSDDDTPPICRRLLREGGIHQFLRNEVRGGKASAANTALHYARGEYVIHLDADGHLTPEAVEMLLLPFILDARVGAVGGDIRVANGDHSIATRVQGIEYMKALSTGRTVASMLGVLRIVSGACGAFPRDVLKRIGGWDVGPGMDGDITLKIRKLGLKVVHEPHAPCYTNVPVTFARLARQRYRWDRSMVRFRMRKHRDILFPSAQFSALNFLAVVDNIFFNFIMNYKWLVYLAQMLLFAPQLFAYIFVINYFLYFIANCIEYSVAVALYGKTMSRREWALVPFLPLMPPYTGLYLRAVRTYAQIMELLHKASYLDPWNPWKVSTVARRERL